MNPGDRISVERGDSVFEGVLLPSSTEEHLVVKLPGGYNVGIDRAAASVTLEEAESRDIERAQKVDGESSVAYDDELPTISLISTGGTIASTVDYRTGAVTAQFDAEDVLRAVPDLAGRANYRGRVVANILSENMDPSLWEQLATVVHEEIQEGADGIVVMHGTDTMQFSAAALAFALETPVPIVFTGSQRSADRPSSDNVMNAVCAVEAAKADCAEVLVCMHGTSSDDYCALHRGTRVRKNHTSRRNAFKTVGGPPLGVVDYESESVTFDGPVRSRDATDLSLEASFDRDVELVKFTPGMDPSMLESVRESRGLVIEGTGLGHVNTDLLPIIEDIVDNGTNVVMTSQCLEGRVCDRVYDTGRMLLDAGVIEAGDTLPGTTLVKLMWVLGTDNSPEETMHRSLAGELTDRSVPWA